jgi:hypothetical protein
MPILPCTHQTQTYPHQDPFLPTSILLLWLLLQASLHKIPSVRGRRPFHHLYSLSRSSRISRFLSTSAPPGRTPVSQASFDNFLLLLQRQRPTTLNPHRQCCLISFYQIPGNINFPHTNYTHTLLLLNVPTTYMSKIFFYFVFTWQSSTANHSTTLFIVVQFKFQLTSYLSPY